MKNKYKVIGISIMIATVWFGSWLMHFIPNGVWYEFPSLLSLISVFLVGLFVSVFGE